MFISELTGILRAPFLSLSTPCIGLATYPVSSAHLRPFFFLAIKGLLHHLVQLPITRAHLVNTVPRSFSKAVPHGDLSSVPWGAESGERRYRWVSTLACSQVGATARAMFESCVILLIIVRWAWEARFRRHETRHKEKEAISARRYPVEGYESSMSGDVRVPGFESRELNCCSGLRTSTAASLWPVWRRRSGNKSRCSCWVRSDPRQHEGAEIPKISPLSSRPDARGCLPQETLSFACPPLA